MTDTLGGRIRRIADEVDDAIMALDRVDQRLTDGRGGEATRAVDPPTAEPLIDRDGIAAAIKGTRSLEFAAYHVVEYLRSVLTPEALEPNRGTTVVVGARLHRRIFGGGQVTAGAGGRKARRVEAGNEISVQPDAIGPDTRSTPLIDRRRLGAAAFRAFDLERAGLPSDEAVGDAVLDYLRAVLTPDELHPAGYDHDGYDLHRRIFGEVR